LSFHGAKPQAAEATSFCLPVVPPTEAEGDAGTIIVVAVVVIVIAGRGGHVDGFAVIDRRGIVAAVDGAIVGLVVAGPAKEAKGETEGGATTRVSTVITAAITVIMSAAIATAVIAVRGRRGDWDESGEKNGCG
jgi:hypothetical protein